MIRRLLLKRLQEVKLRPEDGQGLQERLERGDLSAADRQMLAKVVRATKPPSSCWRKRSGLPTRRLSAKPRANGSSPRHLVGAMGVSPLVGRLDILVVGRSTRPPNLCPGLDVIVKY